MFMKFKQCDYEGRPIDAVVIVNLKEVSMIQQMGSWTPGPISLDNRRGPDQFTITPGAMNFILANGNNAWVQGDFDEMARTLESLTGLYE